MAEQGRWAGRNPGKDVVRHHLAWLWYDRMIA